MNKQEIFKQLISIGYDIEKNVPPSQQVIASLQPFSQINRYPTSLGDTMHFSDIEAIALLKGLVYVERELEWLGGSVATARFIFDGLLCRSLGVKRIDEISAWVLQNTNNDYLPFGTQMTMGAKNYSEFKCLCRIKEGIDQSRRGEIKTIEEEADKQRKIRKIKRAYGNRCRRKPVRLELIQKLNNMSVFDQLTLISQDGLNAPNFYPTRCAKHADITAIESLPPEIIRDLVLKMKGKYRGPWGRFKKRLVSVYGTIESNKLWNIHSGFPPLLAEVRACTGQTYLGGH